VPGAELAVAGITEAGHDVALLVELPIQGRAVDLHVRMRLGDGPHTLRRGDQVDELDPHRTPSLQDLDRRGGGAAGREHRVEDEAEVDVRRRGKLVVVLDRAEGALVAEEAEVPDLRGRHQLEHRVDHAEAGTQDRDEPDPLPELVAVHRLERRRHLPGAHLRVGEGLVAQEPRQLAHDLPEFLRLRVLVAEDGELVQDGRVGGDVEGRR